LLFVDVLVAIFPRRGNENVTTTYQFVIVRHRQPTDVAFIGRIETEAVRKKKGIAEKGLTADSQRGKAKKDTETCSLLDPGSTLACNQLQ
jgi:hypothetical protein